MKTFIKYDFYFQVILYFICILWSSLDGNFKSNFAMSLFFIGCSQTISFIIRMGGLAQNNLAFKIYKFCYGIFLIASFLMYNVQTDVLLIFIAGLINLMAILFLISSFIDYKYKEYSN